jgi:phosphoglycerate dehydrogenase-like enzyme
MPELVLVLDRFAEEYQVRLESAFPDLAVLTADRAQNAGAEISRASAIIGFPSALNEAVVHEAVRLRWIQLLSSGTDILSRLPSLSSSVTVTSMRGIHGPPVSEAVFLHMLLLARQHQQVFRNRDAERWVQVRPLLLDKRTVVILGVGKIAEELARRCKAFGMRVLGVSATPRVVDGFDQIRPRSDLLETVRRADFFVVLASLTDETRKIVDARVLAAMKPSGFVINVARGDIFDEAALISALERKQIAGAGLDAFSVEPLPAGHPFWHLENVSLTPHLAGEANPYAGLAWPILSHNAECFLADRVADMRNIVAR